MFSCAQLFAIPWTVAHQTPLSMEFFRQDYWSRLPFPTPGDLPNPGIKTASPALAGGFFTTEPPGSPRICINLTVPLPGILPTELTQDVHQIYVQSSQNIIYNILN